MTEMQTEARTPTAEEPDMDEYMRATMFGNENSEATDGCSDIEPDGQCEHGYPSWERYWGVM